MIVVMVIRSTILYILATGATTGLHNSAAKKLMRSPILFFDSNPGGRILARFSKDVAMLDRMLPNILSILAHCYLRSFFILLTICYINPWLLIPVSGGLVLIVYIERVTVPTVLGLKRLDIIVKAPINTTMTTLVNGLVTFRVHQKVGFYK